MMKKTLLTLILSTFSLVSIEASYAMDEENAQENKALLKRPLNIPKPDFSSHLTELGQPEWIPQAPIKNSALLNYWREQEAFRSDVRVIGKNLWFLQ
ncbi:MAG: hypothetical protein ACD_16C00230G0003 [uncultured bacterium]|nr:MAG: hypothetical protein ACD_16C00230G0003 [uncultured bacterium]OFW93130.1 MAG: hypothetical protein A2W46_05470 [Alphaproteobacteria bacterium RIFCSPHIGHO2_12_42_13]OFX07862.1 MAG: hypothetical protein A3G78_06605 [Alphaproteobacteria bacterium RIFCSPLOWO2_12_FULL_42_29]HBW24777.1 hypothetical protein [Holosporales bacterium]HCE96719.1 hypothetical protein [Holosporales bacterium]